MSGTVGGGGLRFLPWVRDGLAGGLPTATENSGPAPARAGVEVGLTVARAVDGAPATLHAVPPVTVTLLGPGDVTGLDAAQVIRAFPEPGTAGVETSGFASVEFDRPDLPWMFSPGGPDARGRLRPWLVLAVVDEERATLAPPAAEGALPALTCAIDELPALQHSWNWAHTQLVATESEDPLAVLQGGSDRSLSRIICPTRLRATTRYVAVLVPAYEAGRLAGLGLPLGNSATGPLVPAWQNPAPGAPARATLPVYHSWRFTTGAGGDFEDLAKRLVARPVQGVGARPLDLSAAGVLPVAPGTPEATGRLGSALRTPGPRPSWPEATRTAWRAAMRARFAPSADRLPPPLYAGAYGGTADGSPPADGAEPSWLATVNLEPQHRAAAALGARIVQDRQEDLVAAVQEQAAALRDANSLLGLARLARGAGSALHRRRIAPSPPRAVAPASVAPTASDAPSTAHASTAPDTPTPRGAPGDAALAPPGGPRAFGDAHLLALTRPVHDLVAAQGSGPASLAARSVADLVDANPGVAAATTAAFRRTARPGSAPHGSPPADAGAAVTALATGAAAPVPPATLPTGAVPDSVLRDAAGNPLSLEKLSAAFLSSADPWWLTPPPPPPGTLVLWPVQPMSTPVITDEGRVFVIARANTSLVTSGPLYELGPTSAAGGYAWRDHCGPGGSNGPALQGELGFVPGQRRVFGVRVVGLGAGELIERRFEGDRWIWVPHPMPNGGSPAYFASPVIAGGSLWITTAARTLTQLNLTTGQWTDHGDPGSGPFNPLSGALAPMPSGRHVYALSTLGALYERRINADTTASWGNIPLPSLQLQSIVPVGTSGLRALSRDGELWQYRPGQNPAWVSYGKPLGVKISAIGTPADSYQYVTLTDGTWASRDLSRPSDWTRYSIDGASALLGIAPVQDFIPFQRVYVVTSDGRLARVHHDGAGGFDVDDFGTTADAGGQGGWSDAARRDRRRYAPPVGLFGSIMVSHLDTSTPTAAPTLRYRVGKDLGFDAVPRAGWTPGAGATVEVPFATKAIGLATATTDLTGNGRPDLLTLTRIDVPDCHRAAYRVGFDLGPDGTVTGGWGPTIQLPEALGTVRAADIALADLDGDGRPELVVAYACGDASRPRLAYRIGWRLDSRGFPTGGWSLTHDLPQQGAVYGIGVEIADVTDDDAPDLIVVTAESGAVGDRITHRVGRSVNQRGIVIGGWTDPVPFGGTSTGAVRLSGLSLAAADLTGSGRPDLMILRNTVGSPVHQAALSVAIDLDAAAVPTNWRPDIPVPGGTSAAVSGASVAVLDLDPILVQRRASMGGRFIDAAIRHQTVVAAGQALTRQAPPPTVPVTAAAAALRTALDPLITVPQRALARIEVDGLPLSDVVPEGADPLRRLVTGIEFTEPTYELLRELSPDHLLGGAGNIPADTVTLLETDPVFVESFLLGLNTELGRELLWREAPVDLGTTFFRQFWDARGSAAGGARPPGAPVADIPPIREWRSGALGTHATGVGGPTESALVLVIRGELLRRYPNAAVTARRASWSGPVGAARTVREDAAQLLPLFSARFDPDIQVFCFPLTRSAAVGGGTDPGWFFAFWEQPSALRFGLNEGEQEPADPYNAAHYAAAVIQRPVFVAIHADDMLAEQTAPGAPVTVRARSADAASAREHSPEEPSAHESSPHEPEDRQS